MLPLTGHQSTFCADMTHDSPTQQNLRDSLSAIVGEGAMVSGRQAAPFVTDWRQRYSGNALAVVFPSDTQQASEIVKLCAIRNVAIVPQGGNTSLCGGSVPLSDGTLQLVLNLSRMNRIRAIDPTNYTITVDGGCTLADVRKAAEEHGRLFPLGLTAIAHKCQIGGNLSTNAGGINVLRYGSARDLVLGVEVILPDGRVWNGLRSLRKDNTGYDLTHLFVGAEGTLGIVTGAVLKLFPPVRSETTACIAVRTPDDAIRLLSHLRGACGDRISAFEIISRSALDLVLKHIPETREPFSRKHDWIIVAQLTDVLAAPIEGALRNSLNGFGEGAIEFLIAADSTDAECWWKLRKNISEAQKCEGVSVKHDISVPVSRIADFIARADDRLQKAYPDIRIVAFGHLGDGNIHYNVSMTIPAQNRTFIKHEETKVNQLVYSVVQALGGSISAEHGLGQLKRDEITHYKSELELDLMRAIKKALDPNGLMNPGKVL
jgi:FAD/FMN-containing dehydrogenase